MLIKKSKRSATCSAKSEVLQKAQKAKIAARAAAMLSGAVKNQSLLALAAALEEKTPKILQANFLDRQRAQKNKLSAALLDRLALDAQRVKAMADGLRALARLPDPNNRVLEKTRRPNGLRIEKISVPLGVIAIIYEARPNVTADAAGLCLKAGSAALLRGGSDAAESNKTIAAVLRQALQANGLPPDLIQNIENTDRRAVSELLSLREYIDLLIPRGGAGLIQKVVRESSIPVIETGTGNCHVYVDESAKLPQALNIALNAKVSRPSVCNAAETLLVHEKIAAKFLPPMLRAYQNAGVKIHGCAKTRKYAPAVLPATPEDYAREYLDLEIAVKVVAGVDEAIEHIYRYGTKHSEAIVTENKRNAEKFLQKVDAAAALVNASTRFTDGGEFGFGCEIGISTQKLHARGPMGLRELMSYKYLVRGQGQIRK
ncbi:MAG: glutamate-5-semialdehyde dehydrogenase [Candidatus Margulisbacteria bacterium]|jgi:glutamate-5-semialdehyde dehydrogenase|nr:glutamate-5-semialdehyde dehydrogenase [Candidatus Margulisiibacteriota bacterium]